MHQNMQYISKPGILNFEFITVRYSL